MDAAAFARGFLGLIGAKNAGRGLSQAAEFIQPTLDLVGLLGANVRVANAISAPIVAAGFTPLITVPAQKIWVMRHLSAFILTDATGTTTNLCLAIAPPEMQLGGNSLPLSAASSQGISTDSTLQYNSPTGLVLTGGTILGVRCQARVATVTVVLGGLMEEAQA